jgi:hypothetical protein
MISQNLKTMTDITLIHQLLQRLLILKAGEIATTSRQSTTKTLSQTAQYNLVFVQKCFEEYYLARVWLWAIPVYRKVFSPDQIYDLLNEFVALIANEKEVGLVQNKQELTFKFVFDILASWLEIHALEKGGTINSR